MTSIFRTASVLLALITLCGSPAAGMAEAQSVSEKKPMQFGLLPYLSTRRLFETYAPIKFYLEKTLNRAVVMSTAPDFRTYTARARHGDYDLYLTAPHFAALAEAESGYRRVSRVTRELHGDMVVAKNSPIRHIGDLKGKIIATPDRLAIITIMGEHLLEVHDLMPGRDVAVKHTPSHNNAILAVVKGEADAAVVAGFVHENMSAKVRAKLRLLSRTTAVPSIMFMAGPKLSEEEYQKLRAAMLKFTASGPGKTFFEKTRLGNMTTITDRDMQRLTPYVRHLAKITK